MLVLGANLAFDRTLHIARLEPGHVQRPRTALVTAGGKAVNVCRAAADLGSPARLVANLPERGAAVLADLLAAEGHAVRPVSTAGELRSAVIIIEDDQRVTVLNEPGPALSRTDLERLLAAVAEEAPAHRVVLASGSLPPDAPADTYGRVVDIGHQAGKLVVVDAARDALRGCLDWRPDVVTPNLAEAVGVLDGRVDEAVEAPDEARELAADAAEKLCAVGAQAAVVTVGHYGAAGADEHGTFFVAAPAVDVVNPIGAGDAFAAGLGVALERGVSLREAVRLGIAAASASVASPIAGHLDPDLARRLAR